MAARDPLIRLRFACVAAGCASIEFDAGPHDGSREAWARQRWYELRLADVRTDLAGVLRQRGAGALAVRIERELLDDDDETQSACVLGDNGVLAVSLLRGAQPVVDRVAR